MRTSALTSITPRSGCMPVGLAPALLHDCAEQLAQERIDRWVIDPPHDRDQILIRAHEHEIRPIPHMPEGVRRRARYPFPVRVQEPVHEPVGWLRHRRR